jgi:glycosyltransferase involved in cell wall biosynthesis
MQVLVFTSLYPTPQHPHQGVFVQEQVRALSGEHDVVVLAPQRAQSGPLFEWSPLAKAEEGWLVIRPRYLHRRGLWWFFYLMASLRASRRIDWSSIDVVHAHCAIPGGFAAALLARWNHKPLVLTEHAGDFHSVVARPQRRRAVCWAVGQAERVIVVSRALQDNMEREGLHAEFRVVPNVVNPEVFFPSANPRRSEPGTLELTWVGGFAWDYYERKGGPDLIHALASTCPRVGRRIRLKMIGEGPARAECEALVRRLGLANVCVFVGEVPHSKMADYLRECDAVVLASRSESFGVVLIEAMACGKPVLATRCGGPNDLVTPDSGILVEAANPQALADGIVRLAETYGSFDGTQISRYTHERYGPQAISGALIRVYREVVGQMR